MVENGKFGELYEQEIISGAYKNHRNAIVELTTQNKRIDAKSLINNTVELRKLELG